MQQHEHDHGPGAVAEVVQGLLRDDPAATARFFEMASPAIRSIVLRSFGESGIWVDRDRLHDIVQDGVLELIRIAPSWRSDGGAAPWTWARPRLVALAFSSIGQFADDIDGHAELEHREHHARPLSEARQVLEVLADEHPLVARLNEALDRVASDRDGHVWADLLFEEAGGNRRAAVTVAQQHGLSHANVRKIRQRVHRRLVGLSEEPEFSDLASLPVLCA